MIEGFGVAASAQSAAVTSVTSSQAFQVSHAFFFPYGFFPMANAESIDIKTLYCCHCKDHNICVYCADRHLGVTPTHSVFNMEKYSAPCKNNQPERPFERRSMCRSNG